MAKISNINHIHDHGLKLKEINLYGEVFKFVSDIFCEYKFAAISESGLLYLYQVKPEPLVGGKWSDGHPFKSLLLADVDIDVEWKDSLVEIDAIFDIELNEL